MVKYESSRFIYTPNFWIHILITNKLSNNLPGAVLLLTTLFAIACTPQNTDQSSVQKKYQQNSLKPFDRLKDVTVYKDDAIAMLVGNVSEEKIEFFIQKLASFGTRHTGSDTASEVRGIGAARRWLYETLKSYAESSESGMTVRMQEWIGESRRIKPTNMVNVIATIPGTDVNYSDRIYVIGAHYDSRNTDGTDAENDAPGADDDGSGTAAVLEIARLLSRNPQPATIVCILFAGEEQGLLGSKEWTREAVEDSLKVSAMLNLDMVGNTIGANGVEEDKVIRIFSRGPLDSEHRQLARFVKEVSETYVPEMTVSLRYREDRYGRGGDHISFANAGFMAIRLVEPFEDWRRQHQNLRVVDGYQFGDLPEFVNISYLANITRIALSSLVTLSSAPPPPANVKFRGIKNLSSLIKWEAGSDEISLKGYKLVLREHTSPVWQKEIEVGMVNEYTVEGITLDNYFFGVRAVGISGHESMVSVQKSR